MPKIEKRQLIELKNHPRQQDLAGDISDAELEELARDIEERGLQHPVEILPDGTLVAGHQRCRAAKKLGWTEIDVIVRHDLAAAGEQAVLTHLAGDNLHRRHLDPIARARIYRQLRVIDSAKPWQEPYRLKIGDARDRIGTKLNMTGRNLDRLLKLLDLPRPIQDAVSCKQLTQSAALKMLKLPEVKRQEIADAITAGRPIKELLAEYLPKKASPAPESPNKCYARLIKTLSELRPHVDHVAGTLQIKSAAVVLALGIEMLEDLRERELQFEQQRRADDELNGDLDDEYGD